MKRFFSVMVLLMSLGFLVGSIIRAEDPRHFSELNLPESDLQQLKNSLTETDRTLLTDLTINQYPSFFDEKTSRWFYSVDPDNLLADPSIGFSAAEKNVKIAFSGEIIPGGTVPMIAYTDSEFKEYAVEVTTLPLIRIESSGDLFPPDQYTRQRYPIRFTVFDNRPEALQKISVSEGEIHIRGWSSRHYDKKGFRLTLYEKGVSKEDHENLTPVLGLRSDGDWLLYAAYNDQEKIRNVFSSNLWLVSCGDDNSFMLNNGMEYRFVELFMDSRYWGLYAFGYPIDPEQMGIRADNKGHYEEYLFKQKEWGPKKTEAGFKLNGLDLQNKANESYYRNGIAILQMYSDQIMAGAPDKLSHNDQQNPIDIWLFMKLIQAADSVHKTAWEMKNMMFTIKYTDRGRIILYTPWDMDISWGNTLNNRADNLTRAYAIRADNNSYEMALNPVSVLRKTDPDIVEMIRARYAELRADSWSDRNVDDMLDSFEQDIYGSGAYIRDMERWPDGTYQDPEAGLSVFRKYVHERFASMDRYIDELTCEMSE